MLEQEKFGVSAAEETEIQQPTQRRLAEIMCVLVAVLRQPNFRKHDIEF